MNKLAILGLTGALALGAASCETTGYEVIKQQGVSGKFAHVWVQDPISNDTVLEMLYIGYMADLNPGDSIYEGSPWLGVNAKLVPKELQNSKFNFVWTDEMDNKYHGNNGAPSAHPVKKLEKKIPGVQSDIDSLYHR